MYIFGYFFQKGYFKGSSEKRAHVQKTLGGGADDPTASLLWRAWTTKASIEKYSRFVRWLSR